MTVGDVDPAAEAVLRGGWGDRRAFFAFAVGHAECHPIVAVEDGAIVGTGVGTRNGAVGWVGTIFVAPERRGRGLGRALTETVVAGLEADGCRTLVLVATEQGRPLYEKLGFEVQSRYQIFVAPGLAAGPPDPDVRAFTSADLLGAAELDRRATGEDRLHLLHSCSGDGLALADRSTGRLRGFVLRPPFRGGAVIAPDPDDALRLLERRRVAAGLEGQARAGLLEANAAGRERLLAAGWEEAWSAVRMARGAPLTWQPAHIWGQYNFAIG